MMKNFPLLLKKALALFLCGVVLVIFCYYIIDKPVAILMSYRGSHTHLFSFFNFASNLVYLFAGLLYLIFIGRFIYQKTQNWDYIILAVTNSFVIAAYLKDQLKFVFGRPLPITFLKTHTYAFQFFHGHTGYNSFPSGHMAVAMAAMFTLWQLYPPHRWLYFIPVLIVGFSLIFLNYHFVGDVIAGGVLGALVSFFVVHISFDKPIKEKNYGTHFN